MEVKKSPEADIEKLRPSYFMVGLVVALSSILVAFEWVGYDRQERLVIIEDAGLEDELIDLVEVELPATPPPPPPPPPAAPEELEVVEDDADVEETEIQFLDEVDDIPPPPPPAPPAPKVDDKIYEVVEDQPEFPGGVESLYKYLGENMKYPTMAKEAGVQGRVFVSFVVETNGGITDVKVLRGIGSGCDEEAVRVIKSMPKWKPGKQRGKPVRVRYKLPVLFRLRG